MDSANVRSIDALEEFRSALLRYKSDALSALNTAAIEINRIREWLQERLRYWQNELKRRQRALEGAQAALRACEAAALAAGVASAGYAAVDCSPLEAAVLRARRRVEEAEQELRTVQQWMKRVEEVITSYQRQAQQLATTLDNDLLKASDLLRKSAEILLSYTAGSIGSAGISASSAVPPPVSSHKGEPAAEATNATATPAPLEPVYIDCTQCKGSGNEEIECNACGGTGHRADGSKCPHCRGLGIKAITCWLCEGTGSIRR